MTRFHVSLFALAIATPAFAQGNPALPGQNEDGDTIIVTASRSGDGIRADLLGSSATVLDADAMEERQTRIVSDILRDVPGVAVSRLGAVGGQTQVRIRGSEANHVLVLIDGIEVSDPFFGEFDFGSLAADDGARIEVLRGQQSALYGSDAIGGVIQYITQTGAEAPGVRLRLEGGSFGTLSGTARVAGVSGDVDYALSSTYLTTDGYPTGVGGQRDVGSENLGLSFKTVWTPSDIFHLTAVGRYALSNADTNNSDNSFGSPTYGRIVDSPGVRSHTEALYGLVRGQLDLLDGRWSNALTAQVTDSRRTGYDVADPFSPPAGQPIVKASGSHGLRVKGSFESTLRFGGDRVAQHLTFVVDAERERGRNTRSQYGAFLGWNSIGNIGVVGEYGLILDDRLSIGGSIRHDENDRFADPTTYRAQASYRLDTGTRLHAAAGSGVKAPSFSDLFDYFAGRYIGNPNLQPERSKGWEAGADQSFLGGKATIGATYFDNKLTDEIGTTFAGGIVSPVNLAGSRKQRGVEVTAAARFGDGWRFDASYTWLRAPQDRFVLPSPGGVPFTYTGQAVRRARNIASANLSWAPAKLPWSAALTVRYNGRQNDIAFIDPSFTPVLVSERSFTLVNFNAGYKVSERLELFARVENLLDRHYTEVFSYATPGRAGYGGIRVKL